MNALAPDCKDARSDLSSSLIVRTTIPRVEEIPLAHEITSRPLPSGRFKSTRITFGFVCAIWANASFLDAA